MWLKKYKESFGFWLILDNMKQNQEYYDSKDKNWVILSWNGYLEDFL